MTKPKTEPPALADTGAYMGRRFSKRKLVHYFASDNHMIYFPKARGARFRGAVIGTTYDIKIVPPLWEKAAIGRTTDQTTIDSWQVADRAAVIESTQYNLSPAPDLDDITDRLADARRALIPNQRASFDLWLINKIQQ